MVETEAEKQEFLESVEEDYRAQKREQEKALAELAQASDLEHYETRKIGDVEFRVKAWVPGDIMDDFSDIYGAVVNEHVEQIGSELRKMCRVLATLTENSIYDEQFWQSYYTEWGPVGIMEVFEVLSEPAMSEMEKRGNMENMEAKQEAVGNLHDTQKKAWQRQSR